MRSRHGFTLVELSIVLVIIGLLVGGVLVGQDLIRGGEVKKQTTQIQQYKTAVNGFRDKYQGLPGDLVARTANGFGMANRAGAPGHGDGNGLIEGCAPNATTAGCENLMFWTDLSFAGLISPSFNAAGDALVQMATIAQPDLAQQFAELSDRFAIISSAHAAFSMPDPCGATTCTCWDPVASTTYGVLDTSPGCDCGGMCSAPSGGTGKDSYLPRGEINAASIVVYTDGALNYYQLTNVQSTDANGVYSLANIISPNDAFSIDEKLDDGLPLSGTVRAVGGPGPLGVAAVAGANNCVSAAANSPYNTVGANAASQLCQLSLRF